MRRPYIPLDLRQQVIEDAGHRCGYCRSDELLTGIPLSIERIQPVALGGRTMPENLWLSCRPCNELKGAQIEARDPETGELVALFHPRAQHWVDHFAWSEDGTQVVGLTAVGRATIATLQLNRALLAARDGAGSWSAGIRPVRRIPESEAARR